ncbi:MAG: hypothetical protein H6518_13645 [Microthrixaceae bacterium]|nr:hypothetical protein [Microthrixaceae bacterium]
MCGGAPHADPVHKVTILPTGMALSVTMQLPSRSATSTAGTHIEDSLVVPGWSGRRIARGGVRCITGANNDLVGGTG